MLDMVDKEGCRDRGNDLELFCIELDGGEENRWREMGRGRWGRERKK